jgi:Trk K+ transport system NAD-binding subunit
MPSGKYVIVGLGNIGLPLVKMLSKDFDLVCIDKNPEILETVRKLRGESTFTIEGDATSRLVLEKAGVNEADTVVITTTSQEVNIEVARVLCDHFTVPRVIAVGITQKGIDEPEKLDVEVERIFAVSATGLRNRLELKTKTVHGIGLGKNEILEVEVHAHSRLAYKALASINPINWRVGIVYRDENLIVPRGETVLKPNDRVVILGDPPVLKTVAEMLSFRFEHFPLEYGDTIMAYVEGEEPDAFFEEIAYLFSVFPLEEVIFLHLDRKGLAARIAEMVEKYEFKQALTEVTSEEMFPALVETVREYGRRPGIIVLSRSALAKTIPFAGRRRRYLFELAKASACPILLAAGTFPYERVAVPCLQLQGLQHATETALEMSVALNYEISALFPRLSRYIASDEQTQEFERMRETVADMSLIYKISIRTVELEGNPIKTVLSALPDYNLSVNDIGRWEEKKFWQSLLQPDVPWHVVRKSPVSTLLIPPLEVVI